MPTTIEMTAYTFQELTPKAKEQACSTLQPDHEWWDFIYDNAKEDAEQHGFSIDNIYFSGFYSQGDGASWTGYVDMVAWLEKHKPEDPQAHILIALAEETWLERKIEIMRNSYQYAHKHTMKIEYWGRDVTAYDENNYLTQGIFAGVSVANLFRALPEGVIQDFADEALESARDYADDIYKKLRDEYEYMCSEEYIAELCDANEYLFDENGKLV